MKISEFQDLIKNLYYHQDYNRGIEKTFIWLVEEVGELARNLKRENKLNKRRISEEMADIIAWTNSLANLLEIDLEEALLEKYPSICIKCGKNPCCCSNSSRKKEDL